MALEGFQKLAHDILLYTPPTAMAGHLIILGTWLGAADKHIAKYTELYKKQIETASILLLKSEISSMISPYKKQQKAMEPAMLPILNLLQRCKDSQTNPKILLHIFSNGGINSATHLLIDLRRALSTPLPIVGIICDSVPTGAGYRKTYNAFMYSFPQTFPANIVAAITVHTLLSLLFLCVAMGRYEYPEDFWRKAILDRELVGSNRICYVASKADAQTDWRDVVAHAGTARREGWEVREVILEDTAHCNHLRGDPGMYCDLVVRVWGGGDL
ncbi:indole-diterpene biosynthesis protein-like protein PaxU [Byssothecium circinans]|uniref:Indole-diterpene biosynthesis protein-like protein PaxU n=1 Tax=Byssothecium circinans TaxID=147558 RepID=A0A6A5T8W6_9PLEO|nr:indole-diterpene biosynthesis protein-like protein PaxU [Byssothecium circinans]